MNRGVAAIWWAMLAATVGAVVPVAVNLLSRALRAARNIERYTEEALEGGVKIAGNTSSVSALRDTIMVAGGLLAGANSIHGHTSSVASALAPAAPGTESAEAVTPPAYTGSGNGKTDAGEVQL